MVKTPRIKLGKRLNDLFPVLFGFIILTYIAFLITSYLISTEEKELEIENSKRNLMVSEYNSLSTVFETKIVEINKLTAGVDIPTGFEDNLGEIAVLNNQLKSLSLDIKTTSQYMNTEIREQDSDRYINHEIYSQYIISLFDYLQYIKYEREIKGCFSKINLSSTNNSAITKGIDICAKDLPNIMTYDIPPSSKKYWADYQSYWNTVKNIHGKVTSAEVISLSSELKNKYKSLQLSEKTSIIDLNNQFKFNYLIEIRN